MFGLGFLSLVQNFLLRLDISPNLDGSGLDQHWYNDNPEISLRISGDLHCLAIPAQMSE